MPPGGARKGAGRKPKPKIIAGTRKCIATEVLASLGKDRKHASKCRCEACRWVELLNSMDERLRFHALKYLTDRRDGKPAETVYSLGSQDQDGAAAKELIARLLAGRKRVSEE